MHDVLVVRKDLHRRLITSIDQLPHFFIDLLRSLLAEIAMLIDFASEEDLLFLLTEGDRTERAHAEFTDHAASEIGSLLDVVAGASCHLAEEDLFGDATAHHDGEARFKILLRVGVLVIDRQLHGYAECHSTRDDRNLMQRISVLAHGSD